MTLDHQQHNLVVFDIFDTLVVSDSGPGHINPGGLDYASRVLNLSPEELKEVVSRVSEVIRCEALSGSVSQTPTEEIFTCIGREMGRHWKKSLAESVLASFGGQKDGRYSLRPGSEELLRSLSEEDWTVRALSNCYYPSWVMDHILWELGIYQFLDCRLYSNEIGVRKPALEVFKAIAYPLGKWSRIVAFGDMEEVDLAVPKKLGWETIVVPTEPQTPLPKLKDRY